MGNPFEDYLAKYESLVDWQPLASSTDPDVLALRENLAERDRPSDWFAFSLQSSREVWRALPKELRDQIRGAVLDLVSEALSDVSELGADIAGKVADATGSIPVIGQLLAMVAEYVAAWVEWGQVSQEEREKASWWHLDNQRYLTILAYDSPIYWAMWRMEVLNYLKYVGPRAGEGSFAALPCFRRSGSADYLFYTNAGAGDQGWCDQGVPYSCGAGGGFIDIEGCWPFPGKNAGKECKRVTAISALFFPYWSPVYPAGPLAVHHESSLNFSDLLIARQSALLSVPDANLRVNGSGVRATADRFVARFYQGLKTMGQAIGRDVLAVVRINSNGDWVETGTDDRLTIDREFIEDFQPSEVHANRFYIREDGAIVAYDGAPDADTNSWGIPGYGPDEQPNLGITLSQLNTIITASSAFFAARANMLRNGVSMKSLLTAHSVSSYDSEVRAAISYSADQGRLLQRLPKRMEKAPARWNPNAPEWTIVAKSVGGKRRSSALPVLAAGAAALFLLRRGR
jgi:hypothetical protein